MFEHIRKCKWQRNNNVCSSVYFSCTESNKQNQVVHKCRNGYTGVAQSCLLTGDDAPFCIACNEYFTVNHFLLECQDISHVCDFIESIHFENFLPQFHLKS
jgi:hypothetical protein